MSVRGTLSTQPVVYLELGGQDGGITPGKPYARTPLPRDVQQQHAGDKAVLAFSYGTTRKIRVGDETFVARDATSGRRYAMSQPAQGSQPPDTAKSVPVAVTIHEQLHLAVDYNGHSDGGTITNPVDAKLPALDIARELLLRSSGRFVTGFGHLNTRCILHEGTEYFGQPTREPRYLIGIKVTCEDYLASLESDEAREIAKWNQKLDGTETFVKSVGGTFERMQPGDLVLSLKDIAESISASSAARSLKI